MDSTVTRRRVPSPLPLETGFGSRTHWPSAGRGVVSQAGTRVTWDAPVTARGGQYPPHRETRERECSAP